MILDLTQSGVDYLLQSMVGGSAPVFTSIVFGNGADAGGEQATKISNPLVTLGISNMEREGNFVTLSALLNNNSITSDFRATELGVMIRNPDKENENILFAYGYMPDEKSIFIPAITDHVFEITENVMVFVGNTENVSAVLADSIITVSKAEFNEHLEKKNPHGVTKEDVELGNVPNVSTNDQTPTYETAKELAELKSNEKMSALLGKVAKAVSSLIAHLKDKKNPHGVTAKGISAAEAEHKHSTNDITEGTLGIARGGLGADNMADARKNLDIDNVPNVSTNDQTPTYEDAKELAELISGEKLSVAFGKIKKAIAVLKAHLGAKNPHSLSASDVGAAPSGHSHTASDVGAAPSGHTHSASDVGAAPSSHISNKSNPHEVTYSQVGAEAKATYVSTTIPSAYNGWTWDKYYSFESSYPSANYDIEIFLRGDSLTEAQKIAFDDADIVGLQDSNKIRAFGEPPSISIPITLKVVKK